MKKMSIFEFLNELENATGDEVLDLISLFQCGEIEFTDLDYEVKEG